jgi:hypothetical protein
MYASFKFPIDIVKQTNGNVFIYNNATGDYVKSLTSEYVELICNDNGIVKLVQEAGAEYFDPALVVKTQVLPAAAVAFSGNCLDLSQLLATDFFFELAGSGGGCCDLDATLTVGNSAGANDIDLNNNDLLNVDKTTFNLATAETSGVAQLNWNDTDGTLNLGLKGGLINRIGQQLVVRARNTSGSLISKGSVVKVVGVAGGFVGINLAQADSVANSETAFGIVAEDIADSSNGFVAINGIIHGVNTNAFTEGDILYLSTTTPGAITNVKPASPNYIVVVGYVAKKSATDGHILLHVQNDTRQAVDIQAACSDETTALTTGTAKLTFRMPYAMTLTSVRASLTTAQTSGSIFTVDINQNGSSVLGTKLTIDNTEKTSVTAATPATITTSALTDDSEITIDIDQIGNGTATGLKITLIGTR